MARGLRTRRRRGEEGATTVEFALVSIPALILILGAIQYGWYFYVAETTAGAASTVSRRLAVGDCWTGSQATTFAQNQSAQVSSVITSPASFPTTRGTQITVTVTAQADIVGFLPMPDGGTITRTVVTRLEDETDSGTC